MTANPINSITVNKDDAKHIPKAVKNIRQVIKDKGCEFDIEALILLGTLLDKVELAAHLEST